jgi:hypothetical protein
MTVTATGLKKTGRDNQTDFEAWVRARPKPAGVRVIPLRLAAKWAGCHKRSLQRWIVEGKGPPTIRVGWRLIGVLEDGFEAWLQTENCPAPGAFELVKDPEPTARKTRRKIAAE